MPAHRYRHDTLDTHDAPFFALGAVFFRRSRLFVLFHPSQATIPLNPSLQTSPNQAAAIKIIRKWKSRVNRGTVPCQKKSAVQTAGNPISEKNFAFAHTHLRKASAFHRSGWWRMLDSCALLLSRRGYLRMSAAFLTLSLFCDFSVCMPYRGLWRRFS